MGGGVGYDVMGVGHGYDVIPAAHPPSFPQRTHVIPA